KLDPEAFKPTAQAPRTVFQTIVQEELEKLPPSIKAGLAKANFEVTDLPDVGDLVATDPPLSPGILGLFRPAAETASPEARPTILLYRRNLSRAAHNDDELRRGWRASWPRSGLRISCRSAIPSSLPAPTSTLPATRARAWFASRLGCTPSSAPAWRWRLSPRRWPRR